MSPELGELWYFTAPILGVGFVAMDKGALVVRFRAGGQYPLAECHGSDLIWRDS